MNIKDINDKIIEAAKEYKLHLLNNNILIIYTEDNKISYIETMFSNRQFKHLTGIKSELKASDFFKRCYKSIISPRHYIIDPKGTTPLKLNVILQAINFEKTAKMIGTFNRNGIHLSSDIIMGNIRYSLGFVPYEENSQYYVPNTLLQEDIRKITISPVGQIVCMLKKTIHEKEYSNLVFHREHFEMMIDDLPENITTIISDEAKSKIFKSLANV